MKGLRRTARGSPVMLRNRRKQLSSDGLTTKKGGGGGRRAGRTAWSHSLLPSLSNHNCAVLDEGFDIGSRFLELSHAQRAWTHVRPCRFNCGPASIVNTQCPYPIHQRTQSGTVYQQNAYITPSREQLRSWAVLLNTISAVKNALRPNANVGCHATAKGCAHY